MSNSIYIKKALELFEQDSKVQEILRARASTKVSKILGESSEELKQRVLIEEFIKFAESKNTDSLRLALDMVATPEQKQEVLLKYHQNTAEALGISLEEYLTLNPYFKDEIY